MRSDSNIFMGKPLKELNLRAIYGIKILANKRKDKLLESIQPEETIKQGDIIYIKGDQSKVEEFYRLINKKQ